MKRGIPFLIEFAKLAKKRNRSRKEYFAFQQHQAKGVWEDVHRILHIPKKSYVIDFGCGDGGYTSFLGTKYERVLGVDYYVTPAKHLKNIRFESHNLLTYRSSEKADFIFCASVIEHVKNQQGLIQALRRNLKNGGGLYLSFPPFYSLGGGHQLKPFHYLPEKWAIRVGKRLGRIDDRVSNYENLFHTWGLYKTHIGEVKSLLQSNGFHILKYKVRFFPINLARIPYLGNLLTWHVEFYCVRR